MKWRGFLAAFTMSPCLLSPAAAVAHPAQFTTLQVTVEPGGQFHAELNIDILAYALGETSAASTNEELQALLNAPRAVLGQKLADAGERFRHELVVRTDAGRVVPTSWGLPGLPEVEAVLARKIQPPILMPGEIDFTGTVPAGAHSLAVRLPYVLGDTMQVFELPNGDSNAAPVAAGAVSDDIPLVFPSPAPVPEALSPVPADQPGSGWKPLKAVGSALLVLGVFLLGSRLIPLLGKGSAHGPRDQGL